MNRAARRQTARVESVAKAADCPVRVVKIPATQAERYELERECLRVAKRAGKRGAAAKVTAARYYNAAIAEARRKVRDPITQPSVLTRPGPTVPTPPAPRGMQQRESGLYVPQEKR